MVWRKKKFRKLLKSFSPEKPTLIKRILKKKEEGEDLHDFIIRVSNDLDKIENGFVNSGNIRTDIKSDKLKNISQLRETLADLFEYLNDIYDNGEKKIHSSDYLENLIYNINELHDKIDSYELDDLEHDLRHLDNNRRESDFIKDC